MSDIEIVEREHISLGSLEFGTENMLKVCDHIDLVARETGFGNGEYQRELTVFCKECYKLYRFVCEIE